jgi:hypothetical protein
VVIGMVICVVQGWVYIQYLSDKNPDFLPGLRNGVWMGFRVSLDLQGKTINIPQYDGSNQGKANIKGEYLAIYQSPDGRHGWQRGRWTGDEES